MHHESVESPRSLLINYFITMKFSNALMVAVVLVATGCANEKFEEEVINPSIPESGHRGVRISTRGGTGPDGSSALQARLYCFDNSGECYRILTPEASSGEVLTQLPSGDYTIYALGSDDLSALSVPAQSAIRPTSEIAVAEGNAMPDLLLKSQTLTVGSADVSLDLSLERKVFCLTGLTLTHVPDDVTAVSVEITNLHSGILLNGTMTDDLTSETFSLTQGTGENADTWSLASGRMVLPSEGNPGLNISFTKSSGVVTYSYAMDTAFEANQQISLRGTYGGAETFTITATLSSQDWSSPRSVTFEFNDTNANPVAGQKYGGYYVLSVDAAARRAVVRTKSSVRYTAPAEGAPEADWLTALNTAMASVEKPANAIGEWRIPTYDEALIFASNPSLFPGQDHSYSYFCLTDNVLEWLEVRNFSTTPETVHATNYNSNVYLRPVITISY